MREHLITVSEFLLLRTPKATEGQGGALGEAEALRRGNCVGVRDQVMDLVSGQGMIVSRQSDNAKTLLPTPNTMEHLPVREGEDYEKHLRRGDVNGSRRAHGSNLRELIVNELLPTPTTSDKNGPGVHGQGGADLRTTVSLLPTPTTQDGANTGGPSQATRNTPPSTGLQWLLRTSVAEEGTKAPALQNSDTKSKTGQVWLSNQVRDIWEANND